LDDDSPASPVIFSVANWGNGELASARRPCGTTFRMPLLWFFTMLLAVAWALSISTLTGIST